MYLPLANAKLKEALAALSQFQDFFNMTRCLKSFKATVLYKFLSYNRGSLRESVFPMCRNIKHRIRMDSICSMLLSNCLSALCRFAVQF